MRLHTEVIITQHSPIVQNVSIAMQAEYHISVAGLSAVCPRLYLVQHSRSTSVGNTA